MARFPKIQMARSDLCLHKSESGHLPIWPFGYLALWLFDKLAYAIRTHLISVLKFGGLPYIRTPIRKILAVAQMAT